MYEMTITAKGITTNITADFNRITAAFAKFLGNTTANGHVIDSTTGEVVMTMADGICDYIADDCLILMTSQLLKEDPLGGLAFLTGLILG